MVLYFCRYWRPGPEGSFGGNRYLNFGFLYLQDLIDRALLDLVLNETILDFGVYLKQFPYPCYISDGLVYSVFFTKFYKFLSS